MHEGHRERLKNRFINEGLKNFEDHNVLELLLFYCIPRKDTNVVAHNLMKEFGSLSSVFDASPERLAMVEGMGKSSATFLKLIPEVCIKYLESRGKNDENLNIPKTPEDFIKLVMPKFIGKNKEMFLLICFDNMGRVIYNDFLFEGSVNMTSVDIRLIIEKVIYYNASSIVIAHNHPGGLPIASDEDIEFTNIINRTLAKAHVKLRDHIVVGGNSAVSLAQSDLIGGMRFL